MGEPSISFRLAQKYVDQIDRIIREDGPLNSMSSVLQYIIAIYFQEEHEGPDPKYVLFDQFLEDLDRIRETEKAQQEAEEPKPYIAESEDPVISFFSLVKLMAGEHPDWKIVIKWSMGGRYVGSIGMADTGPLVANPEQWLYDEYGPGEYRLEIRGEADALKTAFTLFVGAWFGKK
jgi:Arc/MetJ-type ribon-helix-helix transcriptional regulator